MNQFKIVFIGDGGVGKTILCKNLLGSRFEPRYVATLGVEVHLVEVDNVVFNVWDCAGQERFGGLRDGYYICADAAVVFHNPQGKDMNNWARDYRRVDPNKTKILHVMSKSDLLSEEQKENLESKGFLLMSGKTGEGIDEFKQRLISLVGQEKKTLRSGKAC